MDVRLQADSLLRYGVNGAAGAPNSLPGDDTLHFLSPEEKDCIRFFENTIDQLEESLTDDPRRSIRARTPVEGHVLPAEKMDAPPNPSRPSTHYTTVPPSPKDQDIIDLVRPGPDLVHNKASGFIPSSPDFQSMMQTPESHFEIRPRRDVTESFPTEYNPPLPSGSFGTSDAHPYHPPGCIPTPVLIAQKIAENQGEGTPNINPSSLLRRLSLEQDNPPSPTYGLDSPLKQGPPTSSKPPRLPSNISMVHSTKDYQTQSMAQVNLQERQAQMLANLSGTSHPLQENSLSVPEQKLRNPATRSISFKDPTPDKSRMEALSKLGLNRGRAMSGGPSLFDAPDGSKLNIPTGAGAQSPEARSPEASPSSTAERKWSELVSPPPYSNVQTKPEVRRSDSHRSYEEQSPQPSPTTTFPQSSYYPPPPETRASVSPPPEITVVGLNSYGGKSVIVNAPQPARIDPLVSPSSPGSRIPPAAVSNPIEHNSYGGKSKLLTPVPVAVPSDLPDILSSHIDKTRPSTATYPEPAPSAGLNSYGGKSLTIDPTARSRHAKAHPPAPAPKPLRHSHHASSSHQKPPLRSPSPEHKRKPNSMFRPQSISVEFCGRGPMDDARKMALRRLGLWKES